jgi:hypothetical protein
MATLKTQFYVLERESLKDIPRRLRLPAQANPSDRVDLLDTLGIFTFSVIISCPFFVTYLIRG